MKSKTQSGYRKKLFDGKTTAQDVWRHHVIGKNRCKCQQPATTEAHVFWPYPEYEQDQSRFKWLFELAVKITLQYEGTPFVAFRVCGEKHNYVHLPTFFSCDACYSELQSAMAKMPSYVKVEFRRGPGPDKIVSAVA